MNLNHIGGRPPHPSLHSFFAVFLVHCSGFPLPVPQSACGESSFVGTLFYVLFSFFQKTRLIMWTVWTPLNIWGTLFKHFLSKKTTKKSYVNDTLSSRLDLREVKCTWIIYYKLSSDKILTIVKLLIYFWCRKYKPITTYEQRCSYKSDFNTEYQIYKTLKEKVDSISTQFTELQRKREQQPDDSEARKVCSFTSCLSNLSFASAFDKNANTKEVA